MPPVNEEKAAMLAEAGFEPDWLMNAKVGDTIHFDGGFMSGPEEWTILSVFDTLRYDEHGESGKIRNMIVQLPSGVKSHRTLGYEWEVWILRK